MRHASLALAAVCLFCGLWLVAAERAPEAVSIAAVASGPQAGAIGPQPAGVPTLPMSGAVPLAISLPPQLAGATGLKVPWRLLNDGTQPVAIVSATSSCGCARMPFPESPVAAGDACPLSFAIDLRGRRGFQRFAADLTSKCGKRWRCEVSLISFLPACLEPDQANLGLVKAGETRPFLFSVQLAAPTSAELPKLADIISSTSEMTASVVRPSEPTTPSPELTSTIIEIRGVLSPRDARSDRQETLTVTLSGRGSGTDLVFPVRWRCQP